MHNKNAIFYLTEGIEQSNTLGLSVVEQITCSLITDLWTKGSRILVACRNREQAELLDEALWQNEPDRFVPHNLSDEINSKLTPIELCWSGTKSVFAKNMLIVLQDNIPDYAINFANIIDFVPQIEAEKAKARLRYKEYQKLGYILATQQFS